MQTPRGSTHASGPWLGPVGTQNGPLSPLARLLSQGQVPMGYPLPGAGASRRRDRLAAASTGHLLVKGVAQPGSLLQSHPSLRPQPARTRGLRQAFGRGRPGPLPAASAFLPRRAGGKGGWDGRAPVSARSLQDGWAGQTNGPLVTPVPFSRFTFSIHKGLKTMDFHFAGCTRHLPKHRAGRGVSSSQACEVM